MILCVISMFIYVCERIGLCNIDIVIMMYKYLTMLYPINDLNLNLNLNKNCKKWKLIKKNCHAILKEEEDSTGTCFW
jgi:hypothetical protein